MRLTLRTLLAYLDKILEPEDRKNLQQKIEESEFAKGLIERSREVVAREDLAAPPVASRGVARDANSVAEYLDNTMAPEQIQEFERICLESDMHLAEVTACHHILTMVLGKPADVPLASRERMYRLNQGTMMRLDETFPPATAAPPVTTTAEQPITAVDKAVQAAAATAADTSGVSEGPTPAAQVSQLAGEQGTAPPSRFRSMAITAVIAALITGGLIMALDPDARPWQRNQQPDTAKDEVSDKSVPPADSGAALAKADKSADDSKAGPTGTTTPTPSGQVEPDGPSTSGLPPTDPGSTTPVPPVDESTERTIPDARPLPPTDPGTMTEPDGGGPGTIDKPDGGTTPMVDPAEPTTPPDTGPDGGTPGTGPLEPTDPKIPGDQVATTDGSREVTPPTDDTKEPPTEPPPVEPGAPVLLGRVLSKDAALLGTSATLDELRRLPPQTPLAAGDRLISLPAFRSMISTSSTTIELDGSTGIELIGVGNDRIPHIAVVYGRVIIRSLAMPMSSLRLRVGQHEGVVTFQDAQSVLGVEVRPFRTPGTDPEKIPSLHAVDLYVVSGGVTWTTSEGELKLQAPIRSVLTRYPIEPASGEAAFPQWLTEPQISPLDKRAIPRIEQDLRPDRSVKLSLSELAGDRRWEIRRLALRCCAQVGYFDPLIQGLRDEDMKSHWTTLFVPELVDAVARNAEIAGRVRESLEKARDPAAFQLYRMLWGYTRTGLTRGGEAMTLVDYLDHEDLDFRVLAFWNLQHITGLGMHYQPEETKLRRRQSIERWRKKAEKDEIVPQGTGPAPESPAKTD